jgi:hypothetical protein
MSVPLTAHSGCLVMNSGCFSWLKQLSNILKHLLHHLKFISTGFFTMCLSVCEMQRSYLELTKLLNYMEHYHLWLVLLGTIKSPLHSPTYSSQNPVIPASLIGISRIPLIFFTMYFTLYKTISNGIVAYLAGGVTGI